MDVLDKYRAVVAPKQKRRTKVRRDQLIRTSSSLAAW